MVATTTMDIGRRYEEIDMEEIERLVDENIHLSNCFIEKRGFLFNDLEYLEAIECIELSHDLMLHDLYFISINHPPIIDQWTNEEIEDREERKEELKMIEE